MAATTHLHVTQLDSRLVEGVGGVGGAEAHAHVHVVAAGSEGGVEDWEGKGCRCWEEEGGGGRYTTRKPEDT